MASVSNPSVISLWGNNHEELGEVATDIIPPDVAIGISRGRFPKGYAHLDANEDGLIAASDGETTLLAVVDGHLGFEAAGSTLQTITNRSLQLLTTRQTDLQAALTACLQDASQAISDAVADHRDQREHSRTAVTVAVLKANTITVASAGDTSAVLLSAGAAQIINSYTDFLGPRAASESIVTSTTSSSPIDQLEYEGFTTAQATYGVDYLNVDWNEQAWMSAESYLDYSAFSRSELIDQLEYEGFTTAQATYGVDKAGL